MKKSKTIFNQKYRSLINALTAERQRLNVSQHELAQLIGVRQPDISKIEKFERRLDVLEFALLLEAFRIHDNQRLQKIIKQFLGL